MAAAGCTAVEATAAAPVVEVVEAVGVVDADVSSGLASCCTTFFTITTINFFSSTLYEATVLSSAKIMPEYIHQFQVGMNMVCWWWCSKCSN